MQIILFFIFYFSLILIGSLLIGKWMATLFEVGNLTIEDKFLKLIGIDSHSLMSAKEYLKSVLAFSLLSFIFLQTILMCQKWLPFNSSGKEGLSFWMAFNITSSFITNTNWQNYAGESTLSNFSQMVGLTVQNFLSAAVGVVVLAAFIRGITKKETNTLGNFWSDITKFTLRILLPISFLLAIFLVSQGVPQTFTENVKVTTIENNEVTIPLGPVASQVSIKMNGSNGGGFYNANGSHPYENPNGFSNFIQSISLLLIPFACVFMFIFMIPIKKQGYTILAVMGFLLIVGLTISIWSTYQINPLTKMTFLEGTETRFSLLECSLWSVATTATSNGSVNCMHSSLAPFSQFIALFNMMVGEVIFGGVGSGLYGMFLYILLTVFLAGLMVGRTPEYLGKKIEAKEIIWVGIALLTPGLLNLIFSAISLNYASAITSMSHSGSHGLSEILYAFSSAYGNNGSAFAGLNANTNFFNATLGFGMLFGRYIVIVAAIIIAGNLGKKKITEAGAGTLKTDTFIFGFLLTSVIIIMGALTFFPVLALGPIAEYFIMNTNF